MWLKRMSMEDQSSAGHSLKSSSCGRKPARVSPCLRVLLGGQLKATTPCSWGFSKPYPLIFVLCPHPAPPQACCHFVTRHSSAPAETGFPVFLGCILRPAESLPSLPTRRRVLLQPQLVGDSFTKHRNCSRPGYLHGCLWPLLALVAVITLPIGFLFTYFFSLSRRKYRECSHFPPERDLMSTL